MKNILVIVDAQNDFIDGALGSEEGKSLVLLTFLIRLSLLLMVLLLQHRIHIRKIILKQGGQGSSCCTLYSVFTRLGY